MTADIAIIIDKSHLTALGLKTLIHDIVPSLSIGLFNNEEDAISNSGDNAVIFAFEQTANAVFIDPNLDEASLKKIIKKALKKLIEDSEKDKKSASTSNKQLSTRETDVLRLVASGFINKEIADKLNISLQTVLTHRKHISEKLGIRTSSGFTAYAMMNGLV